MKLSSNSISMLIFIIIATAVFVLMALRPAVDGNAMNLGAPLNTKASAVSVSPAPTAVEIPTEATTAPVTTTMPEPVATEPMATENNASDETTTPAATEETQPTDEEATEGTEADTEEATSTN